MPKKPQITPSNSKKTINPLLIVFFIVTFLILSFEAFYLYKFLTKKTENTKSSTNTIVKGKSSAAKNSDVTKDWLVYKNTKIGFQVSYPQKYKKVSAVGGTPYITDANGQEDRDVLIGQDAEKGFSINIVPVQTGATLDNYFNASLGLVPTEAKIAFKKVEIVVNGVKGLKIILSSAGLSGVKTSVADMTTQAIFKTTTHFIVLDNHTPNLNPNEEEFNAMISSFRFQSK